MSLLLLAPPAALSAGLPDTVAIVVLFAAFTAALLFYTFYIPGQVSAATEKDRRTFLRERKEAVYENLRDLNFEYRAGKFPESDYLQMRAALEEEAAGLLAEIEVLESDSLVEAAAGAPGGRATALDSRGSKNIRSSRAGKNLRAQGPGRGAK